MAVKCERIARDSLETLSEGAEVLATEECVFMASYQRVSDSEQYLGALIEQAVPYP